VPRRTGIATATAQQMPQLGKPMTHGSADRARLQPAAAQHEDFGLAQVHLVDAGLVIPEQAPVPRLAETLGLKMQSVHATLIQRDKRLKNDVVSLEGL
jgi:hypothetical protein